MTFLWIALNGLDDESKRDAEFRTALRLSSIPGAFGFKTNEDFVLSVSWERAFELIRAHCPDREIFVDLKMLKGKRTMCSAVKRAAEHGASLVNVYALADTELPPVVDCARERGIAIAALTVLSHYDDDYCWKHFGRSMSEAVMHFALVARGVGIDHVILPGKHLDAVDGLGLKTIATGVRPAGYSDDRHRTKVRPEEIAGRADMAVVGGPIMSAENPVAALREILTALGQ